MRAEKHEGMAENLFGDDGEISALLRSHDWSQTPLGAVETWSESLRTAVQIRLTELDQAQTSEKAQRELALPPQDCTQTAALHQAVEETAERTWAVVELARAEAALRESGKKVDATFESEEQSRNILESITDAFFAVDQNWQFTYVNQTAYTLVNRTPGDLIGKIFWEEFPGVKDSKFEQMHRRVMRDRIAESLTEFYPDHDRWYEVRTYPAANGVTMYFRNVTEQIQAEAALRESAARFRRIFESKIIGMGIWTRLGGIVDANDALLDIIGYTRQDLETGLLNWQEITPLEHHWLDEQALAEIAISGTCPSYEKEYIHKQGQRIPILVGAGAFADTIDTGFFFIIDLTERKAAEAEREQLLQQEQAARVAAEQANRVKDEFLAVLSHELRSPLNPILGWTRLMRNGKLDPARQIEALAIIERSAKLQSQLIEDLLDISRILQGKLTLTAAPVSLAFVISAAVETVSLAADAKQIQITLDLDSEVAPISGDAARLQQVVWNLLTNAVKFTTNGGQVTVELRRVGAEGSLLCNQMAQIRVIDTGKGISPQFLPYMFEYFRQEDGSTTRRFGGLGLGLAIVRQIVELHGGTIKAQSEGENQGATFVVQLPTLQQAVPLVSEPIQAQANSETRLKNVQILLVDDDTDTREFEAFLLEQNGATVIATASGLEALQAIDQLIPDVIVSDIGMANIDGYMLMQQIRSRPPTQGGTIPSIALTAYAAEIDQKRAMQAGFQGHLTKPLEPEQFVSAIVNLLNPNRV